MARSLLLLLFGAAAAEIASIIWIGNLIGVVPTLLLMLLSGVIGVRMITSAGLSLAAALRAPAQPGLALKALGGQAAARTASGVLFLLPGFFSDVVGLLLLLAPVRQWIGSWFRIETTTVRTANNRRFDRVIEAEAVEIAGEIEPPDRTLR